jgi:hypothetical protein
MPPIAGGVIVETVPPSPEGLMDPPPPPLPPVGVLPVPPIVVDGLPPWLVCPPCALFEAITPVGRQSSKSVPGGQSGSSAEQATPAARAGINQAKLPSIFAISKRVLAATAFGTSARASAARPPAARTLRSFDTCLRTQAVVRDEASPPKDSLGPEQSRLRAS